MEVYVLVPVRKKASQKVLGVIMLVLMILCLLCTCLGTAIMFPLAVVCGLVWYFLMNGSSKEFEYSYFDGEVRFARVMNKSRRKSIGTYMMDEVMQIAPAGDRSVSHYENDSSVKVFDYTSHDPQTSYYEMLLQKEGDTILIKFEPDDKYLSAVEVKYRSKVIRKSM